MGQILDGRMSLCNLTGKGVLEGFFYPGIQGLTNTVRNSRNAKLTGYEVWQNVGFAKMWDRIESAGTGKEIDILDGDDRSSACGILIRKEAGMRDQNLLS